MMKKIAKIALMSVALTSIFTSCDKNNNGDNWIPQDDNKIAKELRTHILVEKYTGQKCTNCPSASKELKKIERVYKDEVITVALHAEQTKLVLPELASDAAKQYFTSFGIPKAVPGVMINRTNLSGTEKYSQKKSLWSSFISKEVNTPAKYRIKLNTELKAENKVQVKVEVEKRNEKASNNVELQLWVVEDIVAVQHFPNLVKADYVHHNVLRDALNGINGESIDASKEYNKTFSTPANVKEVKNAKVVAFIFNKETKQVYEASISALGEGLGLENDYDKDNAGENPNVNNGGVIKFKNGDKVIESGATIEITDEPTVLEEANLIEMVTKPVKIVFGDRLKKKEVFTIEVVKENYKDKKNIGISTVCTAGGCHVSDNKDFFKTELDTKEITGGAEDITDTVQIHYEFEKESKDGDYKVRVNVKKDNKIEAYYYIVFKYKAKKA
ncbi:MAG: Omp28 family outer membrane lipoprotein [Bacteroides sp.]|nr:Omp28 family outer membrane lipoprotein [Bacteroides sp.]